jgi:small GTP-binding protein
MIEKKKICMVGACGVGKTSLVRRFVESLFDESYQSTIGVKIDKKRVQSTDGEVILVIWDLAGEDELAQVRASHLRGATGYLLVADGSRHSTFETARALEQRIRSTLGDLPFILLLNKSDLVDEWEVGDALAEISQLGWRHIRTSAKSGEGVEAAFQELAARMLETKND